VHFLNLALAGLSALSCVLLVWQWLAARKFPLHRQVDTTDFAPAVSILKALKGCDETTEASLLSWFCQNYSGSREILFAVADANDPVCNIVRKLMAQNPQVPARLIVCDNLAGANDKVAKLARLERLAAHDLILICDADVRVAPEFLINFVASFRDERIALVNCFYRLANPSTWAMKWEAVAINADFWSQVLQSAMLKPMDFALGAAILVRRRALSEFGGFAVLADCLADDYQLGKRISNRGYRIALCPVVVECWDSPHNWKQVWKHQLRWARTIRVCRPAPYFFSILSNGTFWAALWLVTSLVTAQPLVETMVACAFVLLRIMLARNLQRRFTPNRTLVSPLWLVLIKDLAQPVVWLAAFLGGDIEWRGRRMRVLRDGTLVKVG
jgi:ceramide glucosyltransferase